MIFHAQCWSRCLFVKGDGIHQCYSKVMPFILWYMGTITSLKNNSSSLNICKQDVGVKSTKSLLLMKTTFWCVFICRCYIRNCKGLHLVWVLCKTSWGLNWYWINRRSAEKSLISITYLRPTSRMPLVAEWKLTHPRTPATTYPPPPKPTARRHLTDSQPKKNDVPNITNLQNDIETIPNWHLSRHQFYEFRWFKFFVCQLSWCHLGMLSLNTSKPGQNGRHFADDSCK